MSDEQTQQLPVQQWFNGEMIVYLSDGELVALAELGWKLPPQPRPLAPQPDMETLRARKLLDGDHVVEWLERFWRLVDSPLMHLAVEAGRTDGTALLWQYTVTAAGFCEYVQGPGGSTFMIGVHEQLLGRLLLNAGVVYYSTNATLAGLDPLPHEERTASVITRTSAPDRHVARTFAFRFEGDQLLMEDGPTAPSVLAERLDSFVGTGE